MSILKSIRSLLREPAPPGGGPAGPNPSLEHRPTKPSSRSSQQALSGYGNNPYDTYTWDLHAEPDGERALKRTTDADKTIKGDTTNPYDTGSFRSGW